MPEFLDLPLEIRLRIYSELELPHHEPISLGKNFAAEAAYGYPPQILQISRQVSQEARMAFCATSQRPWKINVTVSANAKLSLPDVLPDDLAQSTHIRFSFEFPRERNGLLTLPHAPIDVLIFAEYKERMQDLFHAVHQIGCGIDEISKKLAEVPVKREMEICWSDYGEIPEWETKKTVLQPLSRLRESCSFRLGKVLGQEDNSRQELARYLEAVTVRPEESGIIAKGL